MGSVFEPLTIEKSAADLALQACYLPLIAGGRAHWRRRVLDASVLICCRVEFSSGEAGDVTAISSVSAHIRPCSDYSFCLGGFAYGYISRAVIPGNNTAGPDTSTAGRGTSPSRTRRPLCRLIQLRSVKVRRLHRSNPQGREAGGPA